MLALKVLKTERTCVESSQLEFYVSHNDTLQDIIPPLNSDNFIQIPADGHIKIEVKTMTDDPKTIGFAEFQSETLNSEEV